jgi:hypothetical protein
MLLREDERGVLAIGQQSHAWLSGQLAWAWGNERFGVVEPREEVCLAAAQHDVGWAQRDLEPLYNPDTGLPRSFIQMPLQEHLRIWTEGPERLVTQSRYAALLASLHGWRLYERRDLERLPIAESEAISNFLAAQRKFQNELIGTLDTDRQQLERDSMLLWTWDYLSLALCLNWATATAKRCPIAEGEVDLELSRDGGAWQVAPWPFTVQRVAVRCEGRRLNGPYADEPQMRDALETAPWETLEVELSPTDPSDVHGL